MESCSLVNTPTSPASKLSSSGGVLFNDPTLYRSIVGVLQYLTFTRPDVAYAVNKVSQFMHCPADIPLMAVKHILRYIKGSLAHGLFFSRSSTTLLHGYTNSDWGGGRYR